MSSYPIIFGGGLDPDASRYFQKAGVTNSTAKTQLNNFVKGVKRLGLWNSMVCWPLRSSQNAGTGTTAYSLGGLGTYNGSLVNGPTWGPNGIQSGGASFSARIDISTTIKNIIGSGATIYGVCSNDSDDNYKIILVVNDAVGNPCYPSVLINQESFTGVIPVVTRNSTRYFQSNRGGAFSSGFSSVAGVIRTTSQANFRNGTLIANETGLNAMNPDAVIMPLDTAVIAGRGNGTITSGVICPFVFLSTQIFTDSQISELNALYKTTLGLGLGLP